MFMVAKPRGTRDFLPQEMARRLAFERILDDVGGRHGFFRVQTPIFETLELFTAKSGEGVVGQLYAFEDKGGRHLTLRPEMTAPVMRMVAEELRNETKPLRLSYFGQCYRYEEFKKGRYREFFQYGIEIIGAPGPLTEAEIVAVAVNMLSEAGVKNWELRIGHVGILNAVLGALGLSTTASDGGEAPIATAMRLIDKRDTAGLEAFLASQHIERATAQPLFDIQSLSGGIETLEQANTILSSIDGVDTTPLDELRTTCNALSALAQTPPTMSIDLTVARGLDYYTGMVFEIHVPELGGESQVLGGGSYKLMHLFGLEDLDPCCGFGLGFDRVLLALEAQAEHEGRAEVVPGETNLAPSIAMIPFNIDPQHVLALTAGLRKAGFRVDLELRGRKIGKAMSWANSIGATHCIVVGPQDLEQGQVTVKNLKTGEQNAAEFNLNAVRSLIT
jgi:histidyl-tRNA synthetase